MRGKRWPAVLAVVILAVLAVILVRGTLSDNAGKETVAVASAEETPTGTSVEETPAETSGEGISSENPGGSAYTDVVLLTTTDMHGKCWHTNVLTDAPEKNNMLRAATAVKQAREEYGAENVLLIDNGDLFQGTEVSQIHLMDYMAGKSEEPPAMALCLAEIGYDAFVLGNHEFDYDWKTMRKAYTWLEDHGVPVLAANIVYDGSVPGHKEGDNAFTPYVIKTVTVGGREHKIGILGLENTDITRWDLPANYPGLQFVHPGNEDFSIAREAQPYLDEMRAAGCEFIIAAYHSGLGVVDEDLRFGVNTDNQGLRLLRETEDIDLLVLGHDHSGGYSNDRHENRAGEPVLIVNGAGQEMTKSVLRFSEDGSGKLAYEILETGNLNLSGFEPDPALEEKMRPYAGLAEAAVQAPIGSAAGEWDGSTDYFTSQTDTMDLVCAAMMEVGGKRIAEMYGDDPAAMGIDGLDHMDVDMAMSSVTVTEGYVVSPGELSAKDTYRIARFANSILVLPMRGGEILSIMEENAADRLTSRVLNGEVYIYTKGDSFTNLVFGGADFSYDLARPEGGRVTLEGFASGRPYEEDAVYLVAVNSYILGNENCGLRDYGERDAVWSQLADDRGETIQDMIAEYIRDRCEAGGALTTDAFGWRWSAGYSADPAAMPPYEGEPSAVLAERPEEGHTYVLFNESEEQIFIDEVKNGGLAGAVVRAYGSVLADPLPEDALLFTVEPAEDGTLLIRDRTGRYLTCGSSGGLSLREEEAGNDLSRWNLEKAPGGWYLVSAGEGSTGAGRQAIEYYANRFTTYRMGTAAPYIFNFYEVED